MVVARAGGRGLHSRSCCCHFSVSVVAVCGFGGRLPLGSLCFSGSCLVVLVWVDGGVSGWLFVAEVLFDVWV